MYAILESILCDGTLGVQYVVDDAENIHHQGPAATFSRDEEKLLVDHLTYMTSIGYGYFRQEFSTLETDFAVSLGNKT